MSMFIALFVVLVAVAVSELIARLLPRISSTYFNLLFGIILAAWPMTSRYIPEFDNEFFMIVILAPLLFFEGQRTQILQVQQRLKQIIGTAGILAIISAVVITMILPNLFNMTFPLALIMVAISTPTDATALESVIGGRAFPRSSHEQLTLESLFNDATGLVLLQAGIIWWQTGHFNFLQNAGTLLYAAGGGALIGFMIALLFMVIRQWLLRTSINAIYAQNLVYLLTPIIIYILAEAIGVSGIIAVVIAGLVNNSEANRSRFSSPRQMHLGLNLVNFLTSILNGMVFVILGLNLELIFTSQYFIHNNNWQWLMIGVTVYLGLLVCRLLYAKYKVGDHSWRSAGLFSLGGVHATVTLAMTFSLRGTLATNLYNQVILVEVVVIILSMVTATVVFNLKLPVDFDARNRPSRQREIRDEMVKSGIERVKKMDLDPAVRALVMYDLQDQIRSNTLRSFFKQWHGVSQHQEKINVLQSVDQRRALMHAFNEERRYLHSLALTHQIPSDEIYDLYSEVLLAESLVLDPKSRLI
ncbi:MULTISPECIES: sodium:proton antiporter [Lactiplantibacillus]|uniref:Sodium:proton antiporter n=2 Tax=Lactiplantibacillus pentosus TaxID=1589 RepID=A0ABD7IQD6_LACPE|nr:MULTISPECIES: cation:proton antiporter [Lactiplantibacillus]MCC3163839.1 cation:proton antiporter [Lactiplantibacillus pentosus]MCJ8188796.1 cation:proton antiporter [Lactiplantibacillus pentosus]MCM8609159.1 cation:proton antiporter [Lactiplantibacillus sp. B652]MCT3310000.1 sodium:proton antiporter [Lactiplantibacillus pentosus]RMW47170.1 sodium:proton antiporter [Lactiplantibacillus pentosus]